MEFGIKKVVAITIGLAVAIVGGAVALKVMDSLLTTYSTAVDGIATNITVQDWGSSTANSIAPSFGLLISLLGLFAILLYVLMVFFRED